MSDITALIMDDHDWQRRQFAELDDARDPAQCQAIWHLLARCLETHGRAEERIVYPHFLKRACIDGDEVRMAIELQRRIRTALAEAAAHDVASVPWHEAVQRARVLNSRHLIAEEDGALADFRKHAPTRLRARLGSEWQRFHAAQGRSRLPPRAPAAGGCATLAANDAAAPPSAAVT